MAFMNERLKQFLAMENLSPARFAEVMGIQRSGISHLLAGRNKPSFEFLQKMMTAYPDINYEWLILGKGRPYKSDRPQVEIDAKKDIFTEYPDETTPDDAGLEPEDQSVIDIFPPEQPAENRVFEDLPGHALPKTSRKIARIIVFCTDGTYEEK